MNIGINELLINIKKIKVSDQRLNHLESDVWQRIASARRHQPVGLVEGFLASLFSAQHRLAPIMGAAALGMVLGVGSLQSQAASPNASEMLNFNVFKPQVGNLALLTQRNEGL